MSAGAWHFPKSFRVLPDAAWRPPPRSFPAIPSWTLSSSPGAAWLPCSPPPPKIHENGWVGVFEPWDSEYGIAVTRFRVPGPESAPGVAAMLPPLLPSFLRICDPKPPLCSSPMLGIFTGEPMIPFRGHLSEFKRLPVSMEGADLHLEDEILSGCCRVEQYSLFCFTLGHPQCSGPGT